MNDKIFCQKEEPCENKQNKNGVDKTGSNCFPGESVLVPIYIS